MFSQLCWEAYLCVAMEEFYERGFETVTFPKLIVFFNIKFVYYKIQFILI